MPQGDAHGGEKVVCPDLKVIPWFLSGVKCRNVFKTIFPGSVIHTLVSVQDLFHAVGIEVFVPLFQTPLKFFSIVEISG